METPTSVGIAHNVHSLSPSAGTTAAAFLAALPLWVDICDACPIIADVPAVVRTGEHLYCGFHALAKSADIPWVMA